MYPQEGGGGVTTAGEGKLRGLVSRRGRSACAKSSWRLRGGAALFVGLLAIAGVCRAASAETLAEALADAYLINPVLNAERARLRAIDEQVALAKSGMRPFVTGTTDWNYVKQNVERARGV